MLSGWLGTSGGDQEPAEREAIELTGKGQDQQARLGREAPQALAFALVETLLVPMKSMIYEGTSLGAPKWAVQRR